MVTYERYKGNNIICLTKDENSKFPFSFGYAKAKLIVQHFDEIKKFVEDEEAYQRNNVPPNGDRS